MKKTSASTTEVSVEFSWNATQGSTPRSPGEDTAKISTASTTDSSQSSLEKTPLETPYIPPALSLVLGTLAVVLPATGLFTYCCW